MVTNGFHTLWVGLVYYGTLSKNSGTTLLSMMSIKLSLHGFGNAMRMGSSRQFKPGFFLTPAAEKTKTQAQNSRKKLNLRGALSSF